MLEGLVVVHARAHHVDLHRVEVAGRHGRPEEDPLVAAGCEPRDARRQKQQRAQQLIAQLGGRPPASGEYLGRRVRRPKDLPGQEDGLEVGIDLEGAGSVGGIQSPERDEPLRLCRGFAVAGRTVEGLYRTGIIHPLIILRFHREPLRIPSSPVEDLSAAGEPAIRQDPGNARRMLVL
jgi:hypothetical protein